MLNLSAIAQNPSYIILAAILLAVMSMRIAELIISHHRTRDSVQHQPEAVFPYMVSLHTSLFILVPLEVMLLGRPFIPLLFAACLSLLMLATALRVSVLRTLGPSWNVRIVRPAAVVSRGVYSYIRHPNYLAVVIELACIPLIHTAWLSALFLSSANVVVLFFRIRAEEKLLFSLPGYREAMGGKPRFIPRVRAHGR